MIEKELKDLLVTHLSEAAEAGDATITVASPVPNKCSLVITNGRSYAQLLQSEVVEVSQNVDGVLTITASWYLGIRKSVDDLDWNGIQGDWAEGTEVLLLFNEMYYNEIKDVVNSLFTDDQEMDGTYTFNKGVVIAGEPTNSVDGAIRYSAGRIQGRQNGVWRDMITSGLPASTFPYGTVYFDPISGWTATNQTRMRYNATPTTGPSLDAAGEVSIKRKLTIWYSQTAFASMVSDADKLLISGQPIEIEQNVTVDTIEGTEANFDKIITETIEGKNGQLEIKLIEPGSITVFDGETADVDLKVLTNNSLNLLRLDPVARTIEALNLHVIPTVFEFDPQLNQRSLAQHDGLVINTIIESGASPLVNGDFSDGLTGWASLGSPTVDAGVVTISKVGETINAIAQIFEDELADDVFVKITVDSVDTALTWRFNLGGTVVASGGTTVPGVFVTSVKTAFNPGSGNWDTFALLPSETTDSSAEVSSVELIINAGTVAQIESKGLSKNPDGPLAVAGYADILTIAATQQDYSDQKETGYTEQYVIGTIENEDTPGTAEPVATFTDILTLHTMVEGEAGINLTNHIKVGEELGTPEFGMIRYTEANAFEGFYEESPGIGAWKAFRTEEANLPASSPGYTIRYEDGHWKATGLIQAHDDRIELNRDVLIANAVRIGNKSDDVDASIGMIRYNGDFQGYMNLLDHEGQLSGFWVSLTGGGLASGGSEGEFLVYSEANQKWVSALDKILYLDNQITLKGRFVAQRGLTIPPADPSLPGSDVSDGLPDQKWVAEHPVPWEEGDWPVAAPDGHWVRVLPANGIDQMQDRVQVWGIIGYETFTEDVEESPQSETVPKYGWLDLGATDSEGNSITLPSPVGQEGKMLIVRGNLYTLISDFVVPADTDEPITIVRDTVIQGDISAADAELDAIKADGHILMINQDGYIALGRYDDGRTGNEHPEDFMWQMLRKEPTDQSLEPMPGEEDDDGNTIPEEGYGTDDWEGKDLVFQYHATAREESLATLVDGFEGQAVTLNGYDYTGAAAENEYDPNYTITLTTPLAGTLANDAEVFSDTGVFADVVGSHAAGANVITVTRKAATTIPAFTEIEITIGNVSYIASTTGGNPAVIDIIPTEGYPSNTQSPLLSNVVISGPTGAFAKTNAAVGLNSTQFTVVPYTPNIAPAFSNQTITLGAEVKLASTLGSVLSDTFTVTLDPALVAAAYAGDVIYANGEGLAVLTANYAMGETELIVRKFVQPVETLRLTRKGNVFVGKDLFVARNLTLSGPIILGDFNEDNNSLTRGMVRFNGDFEGWNGSYWLSLTRRLAQPQIPFPVLNQPTRLYKNGVLVGVVTDYTTAEEVTLDIADNLFVDDQVEFDNGTVAYITDVDGTVITLDRDVRATVVINDTTYYVIDVTDNEITLAESITFAEGAKVLFPNGAVARTIDGDTSATVPLDYNVTVFGATIDTHYCRRYNNNVLVMDTNEALAQGEQITLPGGNIVIPILDYPESDEPQEIEVRYLDHYGATLRFDETEGWHYTDTMTVNGEQVYFKEGAVFGNVTSATPTRGMVRWNGDLEVFNGSVWQSLTGYGEQNIPPSTEGNMLVMGETLWQATGDVTFLNHSGPGSAGVLKVNNVLQLSEFTDDEMDPSEFRRGMVRHRGDLEYYTGSTWISLTDYYGLPGGHLPLPGETPFMPGSTVRYIEPEEGAPFGRWEETAELTIGDDSVTVHTQLNAATLILEAHSGSIDLEGQIKYDEGDFLGKTSTGWKSLTARLPIENGDPYDTLYMHAYADDTSRGGGISNRAWLPTNYFQMLIEYNPGEDPPTHEPDSALASFRCPVNVQDMLGMLRYNESDELESGWHIMIHKTDDETPRYFMKFIQYDDNLENPEDRLVITDEGIETGNGIFSGDIIGASLEVTNAIGGASLDISGTSDLRHILSDGWFDNTDWSQESGGIPSMRIGQALGTGINHTVNTFECIGMAWFSNTIVIGDQKSEAPEPGMIRFHSGDFQGWDGEYWHSLTAKDTLGAIFEGEHKEGAMIAYNEAEGIWEVRELLRSAVVSGFSLLGFFCPTNLSDNHTEADIRMASDGEVTYLQMDNLGLETVDSGNTAQIYLDPNGSYKWMMRSVKDDISSGVNALEIGTYSGFTLTKIVSINPVSKDTTFEGAVYAKKVIQSEPDAGAVVFNLTANDFVGEAGRTGGQTATLTTLNGLPVRVFEFDDVTPEPIYFTVSGTGYPEVAGFIIVVNAIRLGAAPGSNKKGIFKISAIQGGDFGSASISTIGLGGTVGADEEISSHVTALGKLSQTNFPGHGTGGSPLITFKIERDNGVANNYAGPIGFVAITLVPYY